MKTILLALALALTGLELKAQTPPNRLPRYPQPAPAAASAAPAAAAQPEEMIPAKMIDFQGVDVSQVLEIYAQLVNRTLLRAGLPNVQIVLKTQTPLTKTEAIEALQAVLALNGIAVINVGDKFVKVLPVDQANSAGAEFNDATNLPNLGSYVTRIVQLKYTKPTDMVPVIQPFAKLNSIIPLDSSGILVIRDYAENVKRMLEMIDKVDISTPDEYISEVIPIRYALASDIASALNSLGGSGGSTVSFGSSSSLTPVNGLRGGTSGGLNGRGTGTTGGYQSGGNTSFGGQNRTMGGVTTPNGTTSGGGSTFQDRLRQIVTQASGGGKGGGSEKDQIQVFGQAKIIADERSNSLLVFATRQDMENIKHVISELDVLLPQVLIESIIMDVAIGNTLNAGVSAVQQPKQFNNSNVTGGGAMINGGSSFLNTLQTLVTNGSGSSILTSSSLPTNALSGGLNYFGNIGNTWDIAVQAAESDNNANIIQRPRIQTSQAKPAQFFVGQTVPYVDNTYNNYTTGGYGGSSYQQLSVGVELDVTPFINPDGLVVMDVAQEIDEISGYTTIDGNQVPNTIKRTLNSEMAVRNRDTVIMGGFVRSDKSHSVSGVPLLMDIPLLGWLFRSTANSKDRTELLVMMRPTVLKTPAIAAQQTILEGQRLPGVSAAAAADAADQRKYIEAERKKELKNAKNGTPANGFTGFFNMNSDQTNAPAGDSGAAPQSGVNTPDDSTTDQEKARAALEQKMNDMDAQPQSPQ
jgi:general secretion pathway protein D